MQDLVVVKHGGGALKNAGCFGASASYQARTSCVAVVSAAYRATNMLMDIYEERGTTLRDLMDIYEDIASGLPADGLRQETMHELESDVRRMDARSRDGFVGAGEGHAAILFKGYLRSLGADAEYLTGPCAGFMLDEHGIVDADKSRESLKRNVEAILDAGKVCVVGGFLGTYYRAPVLKLGARNSNDAFAAALADALNAQEVQIVKDVPGVYRVPPNYGDYGLLSMLSYEEAKHMSLKGSPVVHPAAVKIASERDIPIIVKDMQSEGTAIGRESQTNAERFAAAMVPESIPEITVLDEIIGMAEGMNYTADITAFERRNGTTLFTPRSDIGWVSYNVSLGDRKRAEDSKALLRKHKESLQAYLKDKGYRPVVEGEEVGRITIVGDEMRRRKGTFSHIAGILANNGVSILSAVQGNEDYVLPVITLNVRHESLEPAVRALAEELFSRG